MAFGALNFFEVVTFPFLIPDTIVCPIKDSISSTIVGDPCKLAISISCKKSMADLVWPLIIDENISPTQLLRRPLNWFNSLSSSSNTNSPLTPFTTLTSFFQLRDTSGPEAAISLSVLISLSLFSFEVPCILSILSIS